MVYARSQMEVNVMHGIFLMETVGLISHTVKKAVESLLAEKIAHSHLNAPSAFYQMVSKNWNGNTSGKTF
jgi:hypothetical protein